MNFSFQYTPDPGIAYDITKMLYVKLTAKSIWTPMLTSPDYASSDTEYIEQKSKLFPDPNPELFLFIYILPSKRITFLSSIVTKLVTHNFESFNISHLKSYCDNIDQLKDDLYSFYFGNTSHDSVTFDHLIRSNRLLPDKIKLLLYSFQSNPQYYITLLSNTISTYYNIIKSNLSLSDNEGLDLDFFTNWIIEQRYSNYQSFPHSLQSSLIRYSICLSIPHFILQNLSCDPPFFITTINTITHLREQTSLVSLDSLIQTFAALGDKNRFMILNLLITHGTLSIKEICSLINLSPTAVNHHITELKKAKLITYTTIGRKSLYSFSSKNVQNAALALNKMSKGDAIK